MATRFVELDAEFGIIRVQLVEQDNKCLNG
jgi:hypothetical protein